MWEGNLEYGFEINFFYLTILRTREHDMHRKSFQEFFQVYFGSLNDFMLIISFYIGVYGLEARIVLNGPFKRYGY